MDSSICAFIYNIATGRLTGELTLDGRREQFNAYAGAGGRAGSTTPGAVNRFLANNPFATGVKGIDSAHGILKVGGPVPLGVYTLRTHENGRPNLIRLDPAPGTSLHGRGGFLIHKRGPKGSIGCIVPSDSHVVVRLYDLLVDIEERELPAPRLKVIAEGSDMERFLGMA